MTIRSRFLFGALLLAALALAACSDDSSPTDGGTSDKTPPSVASVTPIDDHHIDIAFSEQVTKSSAEDESNYTVTEVAVPLATSRGQGLVPGDQYVVGGATLKSDKKTVTLATEESMAGLSFDLTVHNVSDVTGNKIGEAGSGKSFDGSGTTDATAPTVVSHTPLSDATNIAVNAVVKVTFSEAVNLVNTSWTSGSGDVPYTFGVDGATLTMTADAPLDFNTTYTVSVRGTDYAGNTGAFTVWEFTTAVNNDHTPPTLVSSSPANLAAGVDQSANLSLTFSEAIDQSSTNVQLTPDPGDGIATWSNGGKTVTFDPTALLLADTQYTLTIYPNGVSDLAGNGIQGLHTIVFTTAPQLAGGSIGGTITGDAGSPAADPTGATVIAADGPLGSSFNILGSTTAAGNNTYNVLYLPDGLYYIVAVLDTNHDGDLDPSDGDAIGSYGVNFATADFDPDSIAVDGGAHVAGKNFTMIDPSVAAGTVQYTGAVKGDYPVLVGLFDTTGFDPASAPLTETEAFGVEHEWSFNTLDVFLPEDNYYVGAYMDVNLNGVYDTATDPAGFYGGLPAPTAINMTNGHDTFNIVIHITDPAAAANSSTSVVWPKAKHNAAFQRMVEAVRRSQLQASR